MPHTIYLKSTDSREATPDELDAAEIKPEQIPLHDGKPMRIMAHQAETIQALRSDNAAIIVNQAMTGDGKSLAGQFMLYSERWQTFAMYPTKELAADQDSSVKSRLAKWNPPAWDKDLLIPQIINANELDATQTALQGLSRTKTLELLLDSELVLTNPDIFHLAMQFAYTDYGAAHDIIPAAMAQRYKLFVFDEFHLFGAAETASVMIAMLLMMELTRGKKMPRFLFLSATPQDVMLSLAASAGLPIKTIDGCYQHGLDVTPTGWRRILRRAALTLYEGYLEAWIEEHFEDVIVRFFQENQPGAKGVIIANSVATAHRVHHFLAQRCKQAGIRLAPPNTGLTPIAERGREGDLLVATSTIDVGVDFRINLLIFESSDFANHLQRLGRLGRHEDDGSGNPFAKFEAHALLPAWVIEDVKKAFPTDSEVCREDYKKILCAAFPPLQQFNEYIQRWAGVQSAHVLSELTRSGEIKTQYEATVKRLKPLYQTLFPGGIRKYRTLLEDNQSEVLNAARSFRGSSPFIALVQDVFGGHQGIVSYNLVTLLLRAELDAVEVEELLRRAGQNAAALRKSQALAAYRLVGWLPKPRTVGIDLDDTLPEEQYDVVIEKTGFRFNVLGIPELSRLNRNLEGKRLVARLVRYQEREGLRRLLRLGHQLELFNFKAADGVSGCVAFGRDALMLDSIWFRFKKSMGNNPLIF